LKLERDPTDSSQIDAIFRLAHTIKGSGLAAGFDDLAHLVHNFENVLTRVRNKQLELDGKLVDLLLETNGMVRTYVLALKEDHAAAIDTAELSSRLLQYIDSDSAAQKQASPSASVGFFDDEPQTKAVEAAVPYAHVSSIIAHLPAIENVDSDQLLAAFRRMPTVLLCDDEAEILSLLADCLDGMHIKILTASNGRDALEKMNKNHIDLVVSDIMMPEMNGIELLTRVRERDIKIPVIFISGFADREVLIDIMSRGAYSFIDKPFSPDTVHMHVVNGLKMKLMQDAVHQLSTLNFRAYLTTTQLAHSAKLGDFPKLDQLKKKLEHELDEISRLTNFVLRPNDNLKKKAA
jgi:CheY-like chemotaxis protein/HPt (histidine-containing phosphotransfer) domain-containing protein